MTFTRNGLYVRKITLFQYIDQTIPYKINKALRNVLKTW